MSDQHRVGQVAKAERLIADALERQAAEPRDPQQVAAWLVEQLQAYGWSPPRDLTEAPPLLPRHTRPPAQDGSPMTAPDPTTRRTTMPETTRHPATTQLLRWFEHSHLPDGYVRATSALCADLARNMVDQLPDGPELSAGLRKLLEAKDCFVRAAIDAARAE